MAAPLQRWRRWRVERELGIAWRDLNIALQYQRNLTGAIDALRARIFELEHEHALMRMDADAHFHGATRRVRVFGLL